MIWQGQAAALGTKALWLRREELTWRLDPDPGPFEPPRGRSTATLGKIEILADGAVDEKQLLKMLAEHLLGFKRTLLANIEELISLGGRGFAHGLRNELSGIKTVLSIGSIDTQLLNESASGVQQAAALASSLAPAADPEETSLCDLGVLISAASMQASTGAMPALCPPKKLTRALKRVVHAEPTLEGDWEARPMPEGWQLEKLTDSELGRLENVPLWAGRLELGLLGVQSSVSGGLIKLLIPAIGAR